MATKKTGPKGPLRAVDRAIIQAVMFEKGVVPMEKTDLDMRRALQQLPPDEARALKRKFRKLWRKALKQKAGAGKSQPARETALKTKLGVGKHVPSRAERNARKQLVFEQLWADEIGPLIERFESSAPAGKPVTKAKTK